MDPRSNATDIQAIRGLPTGSEKWGGFAYCPFTLKLYAAPKRESNKVLVVNPDTNTTALINIPGVQSSSVDKFIGLTFAPITNKLYAAPAGTDSVLVVDPATNVTATVRVTGSSAQEKWIGFAYAPSTNKLFVPFEKNPW